MQHESTINTRTIGLAIFSMMFGAGNIIYPIKAGVMASQSIYYGIFGFLLSGIVLPMLGLITMILFDGNYENFFTKIGRFPGFLASLYCVLILGPLLVMPRCITVPYNMLEPFIPNIGLPAFSLLLACITFIITYKKSQLLDFFGKYVSWILLGAFGFIIIAGLQKGQFLQPQSDSLKTIMFNQILQGFKTLDLIGALFFATNIIKLIKLKTQHNPISKEKIIRICLHGSILTGIFMALLYTGFSFLGAYHAHLIHESMNGAEMFRIIALDVIGEHGILFLIGTIFIASLSTLIALTMTVSEYVQTKIIYNKLNFTQCAFIILCITTIISNFGLSNILKWSNPLVDFGYPIIITLTICNLLHKLYNFQQIKPTVYLATIIMIFIQIIR